MNCEEARAHLVDLAYGALSDGDAVAVEDHVQQCAACREEVKALGQTRRLLAGAPMRAVRVDVAAIYRTAAADEARRRRRWRRVAVAGLAAAAALFVVVMTRLEFRVEAHQFVVRWQTPPAPPVPAPPPPQVAAAVPAPPPPCPRPDEWRTANALLQALADDAKIRDLEYQQDIGRLRAQMEDLRRQTTQRWAATDRDIAALYTAQFSTGKGGNP